MKNYVVLWVMEEDNFDAITFMKISHSYEKVIEWLEKEGYDVDMDDYTPLTFFFKFGDRGWGEVRELEVL